MSAASLSAEHLKMLVEGSGISEEVIEARGYRTITTGQELKGLGFARAQWNVPGLLLPVCTPDGGNGNLCVYRPDNPRQDRVGNPIKYEFPRGAKMRLDCPPPCREKLRDPVIPLWITEGQKKADALASRGLCAIALLGVWNFKGKNVFDGTTILVDFDYIAFNGREVRVVFDSDVMVKPQVRKALDRLTEHLQRKKAHVVAVYLPSRDGSKVGVDDYLLTHTVEDLEGLVEAPRPAPKAAAPVVELLEEPPKMIRRPLSLIDGEAYAAIWPWVQVTVAETINKRGEVVRHNPPIVTKERRLVIVRGDRARFSGVETVDMLSFDDLDIDVKLPEVPETKKLWSTVGVKRYLKGYRPDALSVFNRVTDVVDRFIDFARSLADQRTMAEMVALYIIATYFLPAFRVIGYLWANGDSGCGKSQLLYTVCELAYLGLVILAGGSYASLRDLADYGACLGFDDAENVMDAKKIDPDKRALLLAGNRQGSTVTLKELTASKTWTTRLVNAFCPRLFSAIKLPDRVLSNRSIIVPLVRTADRSKANADPLDYRKWPHDRQALVDDLWALALAHLPEILAIEAEVSERASLLGRALEPWQAILTIALWLDQKGAEGLYRKMEALSVSYQKEKPNLEVADLTVLVIKALISLYEKHTIHTTHTLHTNRETPAFLEKTTQSIRDAAREIAKDEELWFTEEYLSTDRIGRVMGKLRLENVEKVPGTTKRGWRITLTELERLATVYAVPLSISVESAHSVNSGKAHDVPESDPLVRTALDLGGVVSDEIVLEDGTTVPF